MLASGSSGNAALLATENTRILVDAGLSTKELRRRLTAIGEDDLNCIDAILITHEHSDHVAGLPVLARNKNVHAAFYLTWLTEPAIDWGACRPPRLETFQAGSSFPIGDIEVRTPMPIAGHVDDVAAAAVYLASDASRWTTGSAIVVDGGYAAP